MTIITIDAWRGDTPGKAVLDMSKPPNEGRLVKFLPDTPGRRHQRRCAEFIIRARWQNFVDQGGLWEIGWRVGPLPPGSSEFVKVA